MSDNTRNVRIRRPFSLEEKTELALARFGQGGRFTDIRALAERFQRDPAVISRAISEAFADGLVEVRRVEQKPERAPSWEKRLVDKYDLQVAIVVRRFAEAETRDARDIDDQVHTSLGRAMADLIANGAIFRAGDVIGC